MLQSRRPFRTPPPQRCFLPSCTPASSPAQTPSSAGTSQWPAPEFSPTSQVSANSNCRDDFSDASGRRSPCHAVTTLPATTQLHFLQRLSLRNDSRVHISSLWPISLHQHVTTLHKCEPVFVFVTLISWCLAQIPPRSRDQTHLLNE